jgi:archaetidylinositol phosphate synthase
MDNYLKTWSELHGGVEITGFVKLWLAFAYRVAKILDRLGIKPNTITALGLVCSIASWVLAKHWSAALFIILSIFFDGFDGSLAIVQGVQSKVGAVIDSVVDRASEIFWALALFEIGGPWEIIFIALVVAGTQEYVRARAGGLGLTEIGVISIGERPVRAIFTIIALITFHIKPNLIKAIVIAWLIVQFIALLQVSLSAKKQFSKKII